MRNVAKYINIRHKNDTKRKTKSPQPDRHSLGNTRRVQSMKIDHRKAIDIINIIDDI